MGQGSVLSTGCVAADIGRDDRVLDRTGFCGVDVRRQRGDLGGTYRSDKRRYVHSAEAENDIDNQLQLDTVLIPRKPCVDP